MGRKNADSDVQGAADAAPGAQGGGDAQAGAGEWPEPGILTAVYPILYHSHQYRVGDRLPANDPEMAEAWVVAGTAVWAVLGREAAMAKPAVAEPGVPGTGAQADGPDGCALAGKVPADGARKR